MEKKLSGAMAFGEGDRFSLDNTELSPVMAEILWNRLTPEEQVNALKETFEGAISVHNDKAACESLRCLKSAIRHQEWKAEDSKKTKDFGKVQKRIDQRLAAYLKDIYFNLPPAKKANFLRPEEAELVETKKNVVQKIAAQWEPETTEESVSAFRFLVAAACPQPALAGTPMDWESDYEKKARGGVISKELETFFLATIRKRVEQYGWTPEALERWLKQPHVPEPIARILYTTRARTGGWKLVERDMRYAKMLEPLEPEKRSKEAIVALEPVLRRLKELDEAIAELIASMRPKSHSETLKAKQVGGNESVPGKITLEMLNLNRANIMVELGNGATDELCRDVWKRMKKHRDEWEKMRNLRNVVRLVLKLEGTIIWEE